jgi:hypothetical protein
VCTPRGNHIHRRLALDQFRGGVELGPDGRETIVGVILTWPLRHRRLQYTKFETHCLYSSIPVLERLRVCRRAHLVSRANPEEDATQVLILGQSRGVDSVKDALGENSVPALLPLGVERSGEGLREFIRADPRLGLGDAEGRAADVEGHAVVGETGGAVNNDTQRRFILVIGSNINDADLTGYFIHTRPMKLTPQFFTLT